MLIQSLTTDNVSVITNSTANLDIMVSYVDRFQANGVVGLADRQLTAISTAATTTICTHPASSITRNIKSMTIRNKHTTGNNLITVQFDASGTLYELHKATLLPGDVLQYNEGTGFSKTFDATRDTRVFTTNTSQLFTDGNNWATITGLTCPVKSNIAYGFIAYIPHRTDATTTGAQFGVNLTNAPTDMRVSTIDTVTPSPTAAVISAGTTTTRDTAISAQTTGTGPSPGGPAFIMGYVVPSADDELQMRANCEPGSAGTLTTDAGCWLQVFKQTAG